MNLILKALLKAIKNKLIKPSKQNFMTIVNHKKNELHIIIETTAPDEEREIIIKALNASIRWNGNMNEKEKRTKNNEDGNNLIAISELLDSMIKVQTIE